jgi:hypothetical protein
MRVAWLLVMVPAATSLLKWRCSALEGTYRMLNAERHVLLEARCASALFISPIRGWIAGALARAIKEEIVPIEAYGFVFIPVNRASPIGRGYGGANRKRGEMLGYNCGKRPERNSESGGEHGPSRGGKAGADP